MSRREGWWVLLGAVTGIAVASISLGFATVAVGLVGVLLLILEDDEPDERPLGEEWPPF